MTNALACILLEFGVIIGADHCRRRRLKRGRKWIIFIVRYGLPGRDKTESAARNRKDTEDDGTVLIPANYICSDKQSCHSLVQSKIDASSVRWCFYTFGIKEEFIRPAFARKSHFWRFSARKMRFHGSCCSLESRNFYTLLSVLLFLSCFVKKFGVYSLLMSLLAKWGQCKMDKARNGTYISFLGQLPGGARMCCGRI